MVNVELPSKDNDFGKLFGSASGPASLSVFHFNCIIIIHYSLSAQDKRLSLAHRNNASIHNEKQIRRKKDCKSIFLCFRTYSLNLFIDITFPPSCAHSSPVCNFSPTEYTKTTRIYHNYQNTPKLPFRS